ncbi:hypothetical protein BKA63DRAFT_158129 [Paraphoma chrysanthemicola]|nr:hypothetical protein BKA63DRAFT_158129 [Paraphoma chrysanthemicola]
MSQDFRASNVFSLVLVRGRMIEAGKFTSPAYSPAAAAFSFRIKVGTSPHTRPRISPRHSLFQLCIPLNSTLSYSTLYPRSEHRILSNIDTHSLHYTHIINTTTDQSQYCNKMAKSSYSAIEPKPFRPPMISPILIHDIDTPTGHALASSLLEKLASPNLIGITVTRSPSLPESPEPLNIASSITSPHPDVPQPHLGLQAGSSCSTLPSSIPSVDLCATPYIQGIKHCQLITTVLMHIDPTRYVSDHSIGSLANMIHVSKEVAAQFRQLEDCKDILQSAENVRRVIMYGKDESQMAIVGEMLVRWVRENLPEILMGRLQQKMLQDPEQDFSVFETSEVEENVDP